MSTAPAASDLGGLRGLLLAWRAAKDAGRDQVLAVVTATRGSTYRKAGAMALLDDSGLVYGALSGGCLEPEVERRARGVLETGRAQRAELDTEPDADRILGSGLGCRGRMDAILLPVPAASGANLLVALERAFADREELDVTLSLDEASLGAGTAFAPARRWRWRADGSESDRDTAFDASATLKILRPREVLLLGSGPETPDLLAFARRLGWRSAVVERRGRWAPYAEGADELFPLTPEEAHAALSARPPDAALVMSHSYETDLAHLRLWLGTEVPFVGLLGPAARRDELLDELGLGVEGVQGKLHAPVGLPLGGRGPEAIALAIAAELQQLWSRDDERA